MAVHMVKIAYEGGVIPALKNAEPGPTSGGAEIFEVQGVPAGVTLDEVIEAVKRVGGKPRHVDHEVNWADLAG